MSVKFQSMKFSGVFTALITPFIEETGISPAPDYKALEDLIEEQIENKISGLVICGTTAEAATLKDNEREVILKFCIDKIGGRCPVIVGAGTNSTYSTIELSKQAKDLGADAVMLVSPYYNKPTEEGLYQHFLTVADGTELPIVLYDIPSRSNVELSLETIKRLAAHQNISAIKLATGNTDKVKDLLDFSANESPAGGFSVLSGDDHLFKEFLELGAQGLISASANVLSKEFTEMYEKFQAGDKDFVNEKAIKVAPLLDAFFLETNPSPLKEALTILKKIPSSRVRLPLVSVKDETRQVLNSKIKEFGL